MTILNINPILTSFEVTDPNLSEKFISLSKWGYTVIPRHPIRKNVFKSVVSTLFDNDENSEKLSFSGGTVIQFDSSDKIPTLEDLYELAETSRLEANKLFQTELLIKVPDLILELPPLDRKSTIDLLQFALNNAYPVN